MYQTAYNVDAIIVNRDKTIQTARGSITASKAVLLNANNYTISLPISLSSHAAINIVINSSPSTMWDYTSQSVYTRQDRLSTGIPIANPNFENNWVVVGTISPNALTATIVNIPTRWMRLEGVSFTSSTFSAFVWTDKMVFGS